LLGDVSRKAVIESRSVVPKSVESLSADYVTYGYSQWASSGKYVLSSVTYPGAEQANYTYVTADPNNASARPLLSTAFDPKSRGGAQMKYTYNYNAFAMGSLITGAVLENRNAATNRVIVSLPLGGGPYPQILYGNGREVTRKYTSGLISERADGVGRSVARWNKLADSWTAEPPFVPARAAAPPSTRAANCSGVW